MRFAVTIVRPPGYRHWEAFSEVAETVHGGLLELGHDSVLTHELNLPGRRHIVLGSHLLARLGAPAAPGSVLYNLEQVTPDSPLIDRTLLDLFGRHQVWDYSARNVEQLARLGVGGVAHVPIGHVPSLERITPADDEDIDVLFVGLESERRLAPLRELADLGYAAESRFGVYGAERDALFARAKIVLNVHYYESKIFETVRVSYLLSNGRFVVSEDGCGGGDEAFFAPGLALAEHSRLVEVCRHYLDHGDQRRHLAETGRRLARSRPAADCLRAAVEALPAH
jgi:hypothetical protein